MESLEVPAEIVSLLSVLWARLGLAPDERTRALDQLRTDLAEFLVKYVEEEEARIDKTRLMIDDANQRIASAVAALAVTRTETFELNESLSLLDQLRFLEEEEQELTVKKKAMVNEMQRDLSEIQSVYRDLSMLIPEEFVEVGETDLSASRLSYIKAALEQARQERDTRRAQMTKMLLSIDSIASQLDESPATIVGITEAALAKAASTLDGLKNLLVARMRLLEQTRARVEDRWALLKSENVAHFRSQLRGILSYDLLMYQQELQRLDKQYEASLSMLTRECRDRIRALHIELRHLVPEGESLIDDLVVTRESLKALEDEEAFLKGELDRLRPILPFISKWERLRAELLEGISEAQAYANDPNRFHSRQAFKMLKKEEDIRRLQNKTLPRVQEKLIASVQSWEQEQGRRLIIDGRPFLEIIAQVIELEKENALTTPGITSPKPVITPRRKTVGTPTTATPKPTPLSHRRLLSPHTAPRMSSLSTPEPSQQLRKSRAIEDKMVHFRTGEQEVSRLLEQVDLAASAEGSKASSQHALQMLSQAIHQLEKPDRAETADALCDLYHKRSVLYTSLGKYDAALHDSEAALSHGNGNYSM